jgi:hypothetical protein
MSARPGRVLGVRDQGGSRRSKLGETKIDWPVWHSRSFYFIHNHNRYKYKQIHVSESSHKRPMSISGLKILILCIGSEEVQLYTLVNATSLQ